jgi:beta-xylosidase
MNRIAALLIASLALLAGCTVAPQTQVAVNPLTYTDIPDPDIIRVGEDYYMVSTTMYFCPGAPVMHSRDLVHWEIVSYIYDVIEDDDIYNLRDGKNAYGKGQWATTLRCHDGVYYALFVANDQHKTYIYRSRDIVNGTWERTVIEDYFMHDASLLFDDGRLWVVWGNGELHLLELEPDGTGVKAGAAEKVIIDSPREGWMLRAEGSHLYHIGDYYYVLEIDWPQGKPRTATVWRSKSIEGPYESKVVLQGTLGGRSDGIAQGPLIDTPAGDWYAVQFQDHGAVGRIPCIQPVTWVDGWPVMGENGVPMEEVTVKLPPRGRDYVWDDDEFDSGELALVWQWNHKAPEGWSLTERPGWLRLRAAKATGLADARGTLTQRTVGPRSCSSTLLDVSGMKPGDEAGLCAFQSHSGRIGVRVAPDGTRSVVLHESGRGFSRGADGKPVVETIDRDVENVPMEGTLVWLRIRYVFTPQEEGETADTAFFSWSFDGEHWTEADFALPMRFTLDYFTGYRSGLYDYATLGEGGTADFDWFHQAVY